MATEISMDPLDAVLDRELSLAFIATDLTKFQTRATTYVKVLGILSRHATGGNQPATVALKDFERNATLLIGLDPKQPVPLANPVISRDFVTTLGNVAYSIANNQPSEAPAVLSTGNTLEQQRLHLLSVQVQQIQLLILNATLTLALKLFRHNIIMSSLDSDSSSLHNTIDESVIHSHPLISRIIDAGELRERRAGGVPLDASWAPVMASSYRVCYATYRVLSTVLNFVHKIITQRTRVSFKTKRFNVVLDFRTQLRSLIRVLADLIKQVDGFGEWMKTSTAGDEAMSVTQAFNRLRDIVQLFCEAAGKVRVIKGVTVEHDHGVLDIHTYCYMAMSLPIALTAPNGNGAAVGMKLLQSLSATLDVLRTATKRSLEHGDGPYGRRFLPLPSLPPIDLLPDSPTVDRNMREDMAENTDLPTTPSPTSATLTVPTLLFPTDTGGSGGTVSSAGRSNTHTNYTHSMYSVDSALRRDAEIYPYDEHMGDGRYSTDALIDQGAEDEDEGDWEAEYEDLEDGGEGVLPWDMQGSAVCSGRWPEKGRPGDDAASYLEDDETDRASFV